MITGHALSTGHAIWRARAAAAAHAHCRACAECAGLAERLRGQRLCSQGAHNAGSLVGTHSVVAERTQAGQAVDPVPRGRWRSHAQDGEDGKEGSLVSLQATVSDVVPARTCAATEWHGACPSAGTFTVKLEGPATLWGVLLLLLHAMNLYSPADP